MRRLRPITCKWTNKYSFLSPACVNSETHSLQRVFLRILYTNGGSLCQAFLAKTVETGNKNRSVTEATHALRRKFNLRTNGRNNSQHRCASNVGNCCVRVGSGVQTDATTPNNVGPAVHRRKDTTHKATCKRTQHCWPTSPNIVGCYILRSFAHPVACCWMLWRFVAQSLKPVKLFSQQLFCSVIAEA